LEMWTMSSRTKLFIYLFDVGGNEFFSINEKSWSIII
jgi:hypothetical protein